MRDNTYFNPVRILSGLNKSKIIKDYLPEGRNLIITDKVFTGNNLAQDLSCLIGRDDTVIFDGVLSNPELDDIDSAVNSFRGEGIVNVVALGGGSVIDFAKAVAVFLKGSGELTLDPV